MQNARFLGCADRLGSIEPGKHADLVVVDGDPLQDITCLKDAANVRMVVKNGEVVKDSLSGSPAC